MQLVHCTVLHAGDARHEVRKLYASIPEVIVLKEIHGGDDAVKDVVYAGEREDDSEFDRLVKNYGVKESNVELIRRLFPGNNPKMPSTMSEIGYPDPTDEEKAAVAAVQHKQAIKDQEARAKAARADRRELVGEDELIAPPPAARKTLSTKASAALG